MLVMLIGHMAHRVGCWRIGSEVVQVAATIVVLNDAIALCLVTMLMLLLRVMMLRLIVAVVDHGRLMMALN